MSNPTHAVQYQCEDQAVWKRKRNCSTGAENNNYEVNTISYRWLPFSSRLRDERANQGGQRLSEYWISTLPLSIFYGLFYFKNIYIIVTINWLEYCVNRDVGGSNPVRAEVYFQISAPPTPIHNSVTMS